MAWGRGRAEPLLFVVCAACLYLWKLAFKLLPMERLTGVSLYATAWSWSTLKSLLALALFVIVAGAVLRGEGERRFFGPDFPRRFLRALPYGLCFYFTFSHAWMTLAGAMSVLGESLLGRESDLLWTISYLVGVMPLLYLLGRFGFTLVGAAVGDRVSFRRSWELTRSAAGTLFLTALLWWAAKGLPSDILLHAFPMSPFNIFYFKWLALPVQCVVAMSGWAVAAAWYRTLRGRAWESAHAG